MTDEQIEAIAEVIIAARDGGGTPPDQPRTPATLGR